MSNGRSFPQSFRATSCNLHSGRSSENCIKMHIKSCSFQSYYYAWIWIHPYYTQFPLTLLKVHYVNPQKWTLSKRANQGQVYGQARPGLAAQVTLIFHRSLLPRRVRQLPVSSCQLSVVSCQIVKLPNWKLILLTFCNTATVGSPPKHREHIKTCLNIGFTASKSVLIQS